jgi:hypothetical protein
VRKLTTINPHPLVVQGRAGAQAVSNADAGRSGGYTPLVATALVGAGPELAEPALSQAGQPPG